MIVIDASSLFKYILKEENWAEIEKYLLKDLRSVSHIVKEVANSIWKHTVIFKRFSQEEYIAAYKILNRIISEEIIRIEGQEKYMDKAMHIAIENMITVYDSLYIAQALEYGELLTSDKRQAEIAEKLGIKVYYIR